MRQFFTAGAVLAGLTLSGAAFAEEPPAATADVVEVPSSLLSVQVAEYDGKRVRTEFSLMTPLSPKLAKAVGCEKTDSAFYLGPKMSIGAGTSMLTGSWVICVLHDDVPRVAVAPMGSNLQIEGTVEVKGSQMAPRVTLHDTKILTITPMTMPAGMAMPGAPQ